MIYFPALHDKEICLVAVNKRAKSNESLGQIFEIFN